MQAISSLHKDFIASHLRSELATLQRLLKSVEEANGFEYQFTIESLRRIETNTRRLRNFLGDW